MAPRSYTNTKTSVEDMKKKLGILGIPIEDDRWTQFNRSSKLVYESHKLAVDADKTWLEVPFDVRRRVIRAAFDEYAPEWKQQYSPRLLEDICNTRLFRLHHLRRYWRSKGNKTGVDDGPGSTPGGEEEEAAAAAAVEWGGKARRRVTKAKKKEKRSCRAKQILPFDPVRQTG